MFTILKILPREKGIKTFINSFLKKDEPILTRIAVNGGAPFFIVEVINGKNGLDFPRVASILGIGAKCIILENNVKMPNNKYLKEFEPKKLSNIMLFNSGKQLISKCEKPECERICAVIDPSAELVSRISQLVPMTSILKIITNSPGKYEKAAADILEDFGLPIIITQSEKMLDDCDFIISPFKNENNIYSECITIKYKKQQSIRVKGEGITLPNEYREIMPPNIDEFKFAAALYELSCVKKIGELSYDRIIILN
ncbi:MAG: hypothetical protein RSB11_05465 [Oscillospiraceae bacterium]